MMPLTIDDETIVALVGSLAHQLGQSDQQAVKGAVEAELSRLSAESFETKLQAFYARHPRPAPTGLKADKAFFDALSGEED